MNEKIKNLVKQCTTVEHGVIQPRSRGDVYHFDQEKFAELIVRECIHVMDATAKEAWDNCTYMREEVPTAAHQIAIRKHFGVE